MFHPSNTVCLCRVGNVSVLRLFFFFSFVKGQWCLREKFRRGHVHCFSQGRLSRTDSYCQEGLNEASALNEKMCGVSWPVFNPPLPPGFKAAWKVQTWMLPRCLSFNLQQGPLCLGLYRLIVYQRILWEHRQASKNVGTGTSNINSLTDDDKLYESVCLYSRVETTLDRRTSSNGR